MTTIATNLQGVRAAIAAACAACGRDPAGVRLLAISKTMRPDLVRDAWAAGQRAFGENYIQEGVDKIAALKDLPIEWHCVGPVQTNKTRLVAENFAWLHTLDRLKTAQRLSDQRPAQLPPLQVCIQLNVDGSLTKAGVPTEPIEPLLQLAREVAALPNLQLRGVMSLPDFASNFVAQYRDHMCATAAFSRIYEALAQSEVLAERAAVAQFDTLSMGMSADLAAAIESGSTMVRVGTAIFGTRPMRVG